MRTSETRLGTTDTYLRIAIAIAVFYLAMTLYPTDELPYVRILTAGAYAGIVLCIRWKNVPALTAEIIFTIIGMLLIAPMLSSTIFDVRDGNYFLDSALPGLIWGTVLGWCVGAVIAHRLRRSPPTKSSNC